MRAVDIFEDKRVVKLIELTDESRSKILSSFPPKYSEVIAHHITYKGVKSEMPTEEDEISVVGYIDNGESLEAAVIAVNGVVTRPDGGVYHTTLSLDRDKGVKPVHSNDLLSSADYKIVRPFPIALRFDNVQ